MAENVEAILLTDGTGVVHDGRPAVSGARLDSGDWVRTDFAGSALVLFSDGTRVQIVDADAPVYLYWSGRMLQIRIDNAAVEYVGGAILDFARIIGRLAGVFDKSRSITVEDRTRSFRHFLLAGRAEMIFPEPRRPILPGQYARVTPDGEVAILPTPDTLLRELRTRFDRWSFDLPTSRPQAPRRPIAIPGPPGSRGPIFFPRRPSRSQGTEDNPGSTPNPQSPVERGTILRPQAPIDSGTILRPQRQPDNRTILR